ncbi:tRNA (adenosine(37)-N6)-threonylcarbamoyltransferase complex ATPase subunit type 1 TsaE [Leptospira langatensis]|uniref:tRNA threonylcarbamoyladenosine biosynthesis protein TsaE n=1 Tax=Leptospira langatensis TaxID=2484983 RepID=A0A5F1ZUC9_9LEPT|nr:tRNA (adenosine(37)-N6)-threonylcarbamoyltransferase complex ATPase subunit type 1 TsaE [Leptospira langatensis]TGK03125.1 tRNA (adenosine(37)-N6)-threonylcarbamoyltransferase complex ATPase subunit type 1 TsaE [Leptospira langatensis]TGL41882.1 tRNA (adenosine(37)-N6)-threonylcarbamoyltransferase complex ATPase subunit type 1 TsaE [Leptospira langatensis]
MRKQFRNLTLEKIEIPAIYLSRLAGQVWSRGQYPILLLSGKMGSGKTTFTSKFVNSLLDFLQDRTDRSTLFVNSPTYTLMNEYPFPNTKNSSGESLKVYHFDLYRLGSAEEISDLGFEEYWGKQGISLIEWWEKAESELKNYKFLIRISLEEEEEETRNMEIELLGPEWNDLDLSFEFSSQEKSK